MDEEWRLEALCRGSGYPGCKWWSGSQEVHAELLPVCMACPVLKQCRRFAQETRPVGVYMAGRWHE